MKTHHLAFSLSLLLGGCASRPAIVPVDSAAIDLAPVTLAEAEPGVRESCSQSIEQALVRHGFSMSSVGTHVEIEVSFWQGPGVDGFSGGDPLDSSLVRTTAPLPRRSSSTADLTAIVHLGSSKQKVLTSGSAEDIEQIQNAGPRGGRSRSTACAIAAERFADAMVEVMIHASR